MSSDDLTTALHELAARHDVPGAAVGLLRVGDHPADDELTTAAYGVTNVETGVAVTDDTVFQIGSISKVFTTTLIMQLVDDGVLDLDAPVAQVVPSVRLSTEEGMRRITVRQLLCHTSGIDGDVFTDFGRGDDCVEQYVAALDGVPQIFSPGQMFSYSNTAFTLAGRVAEVLTGVGWDQLLQDKILQPLGLAHTGTLPEEALLHRAAVGHEGGHEEPRTRVSRWQLPRSVGPAGLINSTVSDVLTFAACHLRNGLHGDVRLLSADAAREMRGHQADQPIGMQIAGHQGLGWMCDDWGTEVYGHNGATVGQYAHLQVFPERRLALCLLTNGPGAANLWTELRHAVLAEHDVQTPLSICPTPTDASGRDQDLDRWVGTYGSAAQDLVVEREDAGLRVTVTETELGPDPDGEPEVLHLRPLGSDRFAHRQEGSVAWTAASFGTLTADRGEENRDYLYVGLRFNRRKG